MDLSDKEGKSTKFIVFIFEAIYESLLELSKIHNRVNTAIEKIEYFISVNKAEYFTRKEYLNKITNISTSTASRDLKFAV